jgi:hypothetical protein
MLYIYSITLLHVSVPEDHHQVDPQSTIIVIIFYQYGSISVYICTRYNRWFCLVCVFVWVRYVRVVCILKLCKAIHLLCIIILECQ